MTENTNTHLATFKCTTLDSSCRENRRSKFCSKELIFLAGSQANISTAERSRGDWQWHESGESGPRHESPSCWTGRQQQSQDSSSAPSPSFISDPSPQRSQTSEASVLSKRQQRGELESLPQDSTAWRFMEFELNLRVKESVCFQWWGTNAWKRFHAISGAVGRSGHWLETPYDILSRHRHFLVFIGLTGSWIVERFSNA